MNDKDFIKYSYFVSRAKNYAICYKPDRKKIVDGEVEFIPGLRVEFNNGMLRIEKTKENLPIIEFIRERIKKETESGQTKRSLWEEEMPKKVYSEEDVREMLKNKNTPEPSPVIDKDKIPETAKAK